MTEEQLERLSSLRSPNKVWMLVQRKRITEKPQAKLTLALDCLQYTGNMGTILRLADWFGISTVFASIDSVEIYNPKVVQASMGSIFRVKTVYCDLAEICR